MRQFYRILAITLFVLGVTSCETVEMFVQKPELTVDSVEIKSISFREISIDLVLDVYNPNPVSVNLESFDYKLEIEDNSLLRGDNHEGLNLSALESSLISIPLTIEYEDLYRSVSSMTEQDESNYLVTTGFNFMLPILGEQRIELSHVGKFPNIRMPRFRFESLYVKSLGLMGADLVILMNVENPNVFDVGLNEFQGTLEINKQKWAEIKTSKPLDFAAGESGELGFQFRLEFLSLGRTVRDLLTKSQELNYVFDGNISLDSSLDMMKEISMPLNISGGVDLLHPDTTAGQHSSQKIEDSIESNLINLFGSR